MTQSSSNSNSARVINFQTPGQNVQQAPATQTNNSMNELIAPPSDYNQVPQQHMHQNAARPVGQKLQSTTDIFSNYQPVSVQFNPRPLPNRNSQQQQQQQNQPSSQQDLNDSFEQIQEKDVQDLRRPLSTGIKLTEANIEARIQQLRSIGVQRDCIIRGEDFVALSYTSLKFGQFQIDGLLVLTNIKLIFVPSQEERFLRFFQRREYSIIPLGLIQKIERIIEKKGIQYSYIDVTCKDGRYYRFKYAPENQNQSFEMQIKINSTAFPEDVRKTFAYLNADKDLEDTHGGWNCYDIYKEFNRQQLPIMPVSDVPSTIDKTSPPFRYLDNSGGNICSTYPPILVVPSKMTNEDIIKCSRFRSRERLPVLTYGFRRRNSPFYTTLWRCAQCKPGVSQNRSAEDELMLRIIGCLEYSTDLVKQVKIYDARPYLNAVGQQITGKGYEMRQYYKNCEIEFLNIHNIHKVRDSYKKLTVALSNATAADYLKELEKSEWLLHLSSIIEGTRQVIESLINEVNVVIHCSDGWDRTSQLIALAQICVDPYFRTFAGFQALIEKDWISFGHMFATRSGHASKQHSDDQRAPIFLQFLDAVYQLTEQFPLSFEFNSKYLADIAFHLYTNRFGTFLHNSYQEQLHYAVFTSTTSLWSYMASQKTQYENPFYLTVEETNLNVIRPDGHARRLSVWKDHFLIFSPTCADPYKIYSDCNFAEDNRNVLKRITQMRYEQFKEENKRLNGKIEDLERKIAQSRNECNALNLSLSQEPSAILQNIEQSSISISKQNSHLNNNNNNYISIYSNNISDTKKNNLTNNNINATLTDIVNAVSVSKGEGENATVDGDDLDINISYSQDSLGITTTAANNNNYPLIVEQPNQLSNINDQSENQISISNALLDEACVQDDFSAIAAQQADDTNMSSRILPSRINDDDDYGDQNVLVDLQSEFIPPVEQQIDLEEEEERIV